MTKETLEEYSALCERVGKTLGISLSGFSEGAGARFLSDAGTGPVRLPDAVIRRIDDLVTLVKKAGLESEVGP